MKTFVYLATSENETDAGLEFHSNTLGGLIQAGTRVNNGKKWFRIRLGAESHADYNAKIMFFAALRLCVNFSFKT